MTWGAIGGAVVGVAGNALMGSGGGGGAGSSSGSQTQSKEPWAAAQPSLIRNLVQGQALQDQYTAQPFSAMQNAAYNNQGNQSAYMRALVPDLLKQIGGQQVGFDRSNQNVRPNAFNFSSQGVTDGLLAQLANGKINTNLMNNIPQAQPKQAGDEGTFTQQNGVVNGMNMSGLNMGALNGGDPRALLNGQSGGTLMGNGGYGTFKYGMPTPQPGTQQYRDMSAYFANGGVDPNNYYGKGGDYRDPSASPYAYLFGGGQTNGGVGIGDTGANAAASASGNGAW